MFNVLEQLVPVSGHTCCLYRYCIVFLMAWKVIWLDIVWTYQIRSGGAGLFFLSVSINIVVPIFLYGLSVYGASSNDLNNVQHFLDRCYKRRYISRKLIIRELLERLDFHIFRKTLSTNSPLVKILPERNFTNYELRKLCFYHPIVATERFKSSHVNRLIFSYDINSLM